MLLAVAVSASALVIELIGGAAAAAIVVPVALYLTMQLLLSVPWRRSSSDWFDATRLVLAAGAVMIIGGEAGEELALPMASLYLPIVAMGAALGARATIISGAAALTAYFGPIVRFGPMQERCWRSSSEASR